MPLRLHLFLILRIRSFVTQVNDNQSAPFFSLLSEISCIYFAAERAEAIGKREEDDY
jgi:TorA maturation chaperone TorD